MSRLRKLALMHHVFGKDEAHTCGECSNFVSGCYRGRSLRKCYVYGMTHSEASDWAKSWTACGQFGREYSGNRIIDRVRHNSSPTREPEQPLEGQISLEELT